VRSPTPPADVQLTEDLARRLVADQFPHYAHLPVRAVAGGWDNEMFRVGDHVAARLPRRQLGADLSGTEHHWLARVGSSWTFAVPLPVAVGEPGQGYPWWWSIVPWIEGTPLFEAPLSPEGAADLGRALAQVHAPPPPGAPLNPFRSSPLASRVDKLDERLATLAAHDDWTLDGDALRSAVVEADSADVATWCHLDLHGNNVLSRDGRLAGIVDWGDSGAGDPATDLGQAAYLVGASLFTHVANAYAESGGVADPHAPRVRAEAAYFAVTMACADDARYAASGWAALEGLGLAERR
jgi:aminoglycoside phosphotransferase (APT) family kinase protein